MSLGDSQNCYMLWIRSDMVICHTHTHTPHPVNKDITKLKKNFYTYLQNIVEIFTCLINIALNN